MIRPSPFLLATLLAACARPTAVPAGPLTSALLASPAQFGETPAGAEHALERLDALAAAVRARAASGRSQREALREEVFGHAGFTREVDDTSLRYVWLASVLEHRRGSCVGLGTLYLALGERLGWTLAAAMMPGHFYVRIHEQGAWHDLELLHAGKEEPDAWYAQRFPIPGGGAREYGRALSLPEVRAVIAYDVGNERRRQQRWRDAQRAFDRARRDFPDFAEAHASFAALAQLRGAYADAADAYAAAHHANPNLPGLAQNRALLTAERSPLP